ncbi:MAG: Fic family protein [Pseudomonadota bacterium]
MAKWLWQHKDWPNLVWRQCELTALLRDASDRLGQLKGKSTLVEDNEEFNLDALVTNIVASSAIESEKVDVYAVRSSLARQLGIDDHSPVKADGSSEGLASLMRAAVTELEKPLEFEALLKWHGWLFEHHDSLMQRIEPGVLRGDAPMQIVSGPITRANIHFEAPPRDTIKFELAEFIAWFNKTQHDTAYDPLIRAGIAHLWFVTIHPFEDGNGRITRALTDRALAQADKQSIRLFAMSEAILAKRSGYYDILEYTQKHDNDITAWLVWFVSTLIEAIDGALARIDRIVNKTKFWARHSNKDLHANQQKVLNRLLNGDFAEGINASQYKAVAKVSKATATRHLTDLVAQGLLYKTGSGGRSTRYKVVGVNQDD